MSIEEPSKEKEMEQRRIKINFMLTKGMTEGEIATNIGVSLSTIEKDVAWLRNASKSWIDTLAKGGFVFEWQKHQEKVRDSERQLNVMLEETITDPINPKKPDGKPNLIYKVQGEMRAKMLKQRDDNVALQNQMMLDGPTVHIMKTRLEGIGTGEISNKFSQAG